MRPVPEQRRTRTGPHRQLYVLLTGLGLEVREEVRVGPYSVDMFCDDLWLAFEADGLWHGAARDGRRDLWLLESAGIPVFRVREALLKTPDVARQRVLKFVERYEKTVAERKEAGRWIVN